LKSNKMLLLWNFVNPLEICYTYNISNKIIGRRRLSDQENMQNSQVSKVENINVVQLQKSLELLLLLLSIAFAVCSDFHGGGSFHLHLGYRSRWPDQEKTKTEKSQANCDLAIEYEVESKQGGN
jgi:hypothetical protein